MKKAQVSLEFLVTYGWVLILIIVAIGALSYFGVFSPSRYVKESCEISNQLVCEDFEIWTNKIDLDLRNEFGREIEIVQLNITSEDYGSFIDCEKACGSFSIKNGETSSPYCYDAGISLPPRNKIPFTIEISYQREPGAPMHRAVGTLLGNVRSLTYGGGAHLCP